MGTTDPEASAAPVPDDIRLENRRRLYRLVQRAPGIHLREVVRALEMAYGTAEYHLRVLEERGLVRAVEEDNRRRYYVAAVAHSDRRAIGLMRKGSIRRVLIALVERGEMTHQELSAASGVKPPNLSHHLQRMEGEGLVRRRKEGRFTRIEVANAAMVERLLLQHGRSFGDEAVDRFLDTWGPFEVRPGKPDEPGGQGGHDGPAGPPTAVGRRRREEGGPGGPPEAQTQPESAGGG